MTDPVITIDEILPEYSIKSYARALTGLTLREGVKLTMFNWQLYDKLYYIDMRGMSESERVNVRRIQNTLFAEDEIIEEALQKSNDVY